MDEIEVFKKENARLKEILCEFYIGVESKCTTIVASEVVIDGDFLYHVRGWLEGVMGWEVNCRKDAWSDIVQKAFHLWEKKEKEGIDLEMECADIGYGGEL